MVIRFLKFSEIIHLQEYLRTNWRRSILDKDIGFFKWTYYRNNPKNEIVDFVIEIDDVSNNIVSCLGFIQTKKFISNSQNLPNTIWLTNWKSISNNALSGIKLLKFLEANNDFEMIGTIGCNSIAKKIYKALGFKTGKMRRFLALNTNIKEFKIISKDSLDKLFKIYSNLNLDTKNKEFSNNSNLLKISDLEFSELDISEKELNNCLPYKDKNYFFHRYVKHPIFQYEIYSFSKNNKTICIVARKCFKDTVFALRIIDILGDINLLFANSEEIMRGLFVENPEYIDFYFHTNFEINPISNKYFFEITNDNQICIPGYFEPFVNSSPEIYFAYKTSSKFVGKEIFFKGDCDQDRPS